MKIQAITIKNNFLLIKDMSGVITKGDYCLSIVLNSGIDIDVPYNSKEKMLESYTKLSKLIKEYNNIKAEEIAVL
ncbi:MAG: hypothetical protein ACRC1T_09980 [Clostridium chrysemydis]|uniref:hypothetical protein n=1 Tax=Clostridium chrysemydis TaxID=2665504 RepID=UPI003F329ECF